MTKIAATLSIKDAAEMTQEGRQSVANWLRMQARDLVELGGNYDDKFRANYFYSEQKKS